ncbi:lactate/malate family dehydrogenase [Staphylococcus epidermidis]
MEPLSKLSDLLEANQKIFKAIITKIMENHFKCIFIIASNPVDTLSYITKEISVFPKEKVIGSGTIIDSARFQFKLSEIYTVSHYNIQAMILGEPGDSQVPKWSKETIPGGPIKKKNQNVLEEKKK